MKQKQRAAAPGAAPPGVLLTPRHKKWKYLKENYPFLIMLLPAVVVVFLFN